jgi:Cof subfamily protein (haloacid dehalogenase superfamily)
LLFKVVFLDIDGTILMPDHTYSNSTKEAIAQIQEKGIKVFIATGRPLHEIQELADELNVDSFIGYNGAYAVYNHENILNERFNKKEITAFLEIAKKHHHEMVFYTSNKNYYTSLHHPLVEDFNKNFSLNQNALLNEDMMDQVLSMNILNLAPSQTNLYQLNENIRLSQVQGEGNEHAYDVLRLDVNKGEAVKKVLRTLNIPKEQAIAFGDGMNDKEMLESVGESFAMGNANPSLFQYAKHKTTSVMESGIYTGLKQLGLVN